MCRLTVLLLLLCPAALVAQPPKVELKKGKKIAVLVGVNGYANKPFENLKFAEADMTALKEKLEAAGFKVILLLGSGTGDSEASRATIVATLIDKGEENTRFAFRDVTDSDDQILVAFSGHGEQIIIKEDEDGKKIEREVPFFAPKRAESGKPSTQVSLNAVLKTFDGGKAKALLLVDACRSFAENRDGTKGAIIDRKMVVSLRPNVGGMFAASDRQAAREHEKAGDGHGLFFQALLTAMADEKSRDKDGNLVWARMTDEIGDLVKAKSRDLFPTLGDNEHQVPQPFGGFPDKFVLASVAGEPKAGEVRKFEVAAGVFLEFCYVPKSNGKVTLGSPVGEKDRSESETEHEYEEKSGFWLGKYAVTQGEWTGVMGTSPFAFHKDGQGAKDVAGLVTTRFPAETVSWEDAQNFLGKLNGRSGVAKAFGGKAKFVLPHEDRWEYAYRGGLGNARAFYWGDELNGERANCDGNYPYGTTAKGEYKRRPTAVGEYESKAKHPWGLCDMSGNVWQWCENEYSNDNKSRVLRGGSWDYNARYCRAANRNYFAPADRDGFVGFRVCVALD